MERGSAAAAGIALVVAVSAFGGGAWLLAGAATDPSRPSLLAHTPFESFLVPGLLLVFAVGGTNLACALATWRRTRAAVDMTILAGGTLTLWIIAEAALLRGVYWLHLVYGGLGVALLALGVRAAWRSRRPRHRWVVAVTAAEACGFLAPTLAGMIAVAAGTGAASRALILVAAGMVEGLALGAGQAAVLPLPVCRSRYALLTALGAGVAWASAMAAVLLARSEAVPLALTIAAVAAAATVGLASIGTAQWIELRQWSPSARRWIRWTALAWTAALPISMAPAPFVDASTPLAPLIALWGAAGLLMAYVMALVTWQGVRRLQTLSGVLRGR